MKIAVLAPGPSLSTHRPTVFDKYDLRIGVNRATHYIPCDWMAAADWVLFKHHAPAHASKLFTSEDAARTLPGRFPRLGEFPVTKFGEVESFLSSYEFQWRGKTFTAALVLAGWLGATQIDVYGNDQTNDPDFDGVTVAGCIRDANRWDGERQVVNKIVTEFERRGIKVRFIGPDR